MFASTRQVHLMGALARPLAAGADAERRRPDPGRCPAPLESEAVLPALRRPWNATPAVCDGTGQ